MKKIVETNIGKVDLTAHDLRPGPSVVKKQVTKSHDPFIGTLPAIIVMITIFAVITALFGY